MAEVFLTLAVFALKAALVALLAATVFVVGYTAWTNGYWKRKKIPYDKPAPVIGNLGFLMRRSFWDYLLGLYQRHPDEYVGISLAHQPALVVQSRELAKRVLVQDADVFNERFLYCAESDPLGALCLFVVKNPVWTQMRQECSPMFTPSRLKTLTELMNVNAAALVRRIDQDLAANNDIVLKSTFGMYTADTVAFSVFGLRMSVLSGQQSPLWDVTCNLGKLTLRRGLEFNLVFLLPLLGALLRVSFFSVPASDMIRKIFRAVVEERKTSGVATDKDLVTLLLKIKENMKLPNDPELAENLMLAQAAVFILGSVDTSSTTLTYLLHELAHHPDEQEKLYREVDDALREAGTEYLDYGQLIKLKYLTSCMQETLRKYPPVPYTDRVCNREYRVDDRLTLPKGTPVFVNLLGLHYNEQYYDEPHTWRPERFDGDSDGDHRNYTWLPFGEGPHYCIGKRYGMMQIRAALAQVIHKFRVEPSSDPYEMKTHPYKMLISPKDGGRVKIIPRK